MPSTMQNALTKAFEPDFALELRPISSPKGATVIMHKILDMLEIAGYEYTTNTTGTTLFIKLPKQQHKP